MRAHPDITLNLNLSMDNIGEKHDQHRGLAGKKIIVITADGRLMPCEPLWLEETIRKNPDMNHYLMADLKDFDYDVRAALATERAKKVKSFVAEKKCWCSYICAIQNGILFSPENYPRILLKAIWK